MGSGKSTLAKILSQKLNLPAYDLDELIEKDLDQSISSIFEKKGEIFFRKKEHSIFKEMIAKPESFILSLGGGTPCYANNHLLLQDDSVVSIYLKTSIDTLAQRLKNNVSERPLLVQNNEEPLETYIAKQLFDRSYFYYQAKKVITVDNKTIEEVITEVLHYLA